MKGVKKGLQRMGNAYLNKAKFDKFRSNSQMNRNKKSVSIVSLSPNENFNYGKDMILYNPYSKGLSKQKIHLPYLKKNRRAIPRIRHEVKNTKPRVERSMNNASIDVLTSSNKK